MTALAFLMIPVLLIPVLLIPLTRPVHGAVVERGSAAGPVNLGGELRVDYSVKGEELPCEPGCTN